MHFEENFLKKAKMSKKTKWTGILNTPIRTLDVNRPEGYSVVDADTTERNNQKMRELLDKALDDELNKRFTELFIHYEIEDRSNWQMIAYKLAEEFVPGFKTELNIIHNNEGAIKWETPNIGRTLEWTDKKLEKLLIDVETIKKKEKLKTEMEACRLLPRRDKFWMATDAHRGTIDQWIKTLHSRLQDAKSNKKRVESEVIRLNEALAKIQKKYK